MQDNLRMGPSSMLMTMGRIILHFLNTTMVDTAYGLFFIVSLLKPDQILGAQRSINFRLLHRVLLRQNVPKLNLPSVVHSGPFLWKKIMILAHLDLYNGYISVPRLRYLLLQKLASGKVDYPLAQRFPSGPSRTRLS